MTDRRSVRTVVSEICDEYVSLEERDRIVNHDEIVHLCLAFDELNNAAHAADRREVWQELEQLGELIEQRLEAITWRDDAIETEVSR